MSEKSIAVYIRLSLADEDTGKKKDESDSIVNQRSLIHGFLDRHKELSGLPRTEFVDDGYSGTRLDRPAFMRMMEQIKKGMFSVCVSKDFSRVFRDYIEMGDCLECLFPSLGVRYISINDGYDSKDYKGTTGGLDVVMRNIVYSAYSRDLSVKESTGKRQSAKKGRRATGQPCYGYMADPDNKAMDIIDPETAPIVREIFDLALAGRPVMAIAETLNTRGIITPGMYFRQHNPGTSKFKSQARHTYWTSGAVRNILDRFNYTGASVNGLRHQVSPCSKKSVANKMEDWIIVPGMHEAIITEDEYRTVQAMLHKGHDPIRPGELYNLKSLVVCGNCGCNMTRILKEQVFACQYRYYKKSGECKNIRSPKEKDLEKIVFNAIQEYMELVKHESRRAKQKETRLRKRVKTVNGELVDVEKEMESIRQEKLKLYESYCSEVIDKGQFIEEKGILDEKLAKTEKNALELREFLNNGGHFTQGISSEAKAACEAYKSEDHLTYDMAHAFIDRIIIHAEDSIEIKWRFKDIFEEDKRLDGIDRVSDNPGL